MQANAPYILECTHTPPHIIECRLESMHCIYDSGGSTSYTFSVHAQCLHIIEYRHDELRTMGCRHAPGAYCAAHNRCTHMALHLRERRHAALHILECTPAALHIIERRFNALHTLECTHAAPHIIERMHDGLHIIGHRLDELQLSY